MRALAILVALVAFAPSAALADPAQCDAKDMRALCAQAMNADPSFAQSIVQTINAKTAQEHLDAADHVAKNERHVILAYAALWVLAAGFVVFLWRRQQLLRAEIAQLRKDLDAAAKEPANK